MTKNTITIGLVALLLGLGGGVLPRFLNEVYLDPVLFRKPGIMVRWTIHSTLLFRQESLPGFLNSIYITFTFLSFSWEIIYLEKKYIVSIKSKRVLRKSLYVHGSL